MLPLEQVKSAGLDGANVFKSSSKLLTLLLCVLFNVKVSLNFPLLRAVHEHDAAPSFIPHISLCAPSCSSHPNKISLTNCLHAILVQEDAKGSMAYV